MKFNARLITADNCTKEIQTDEARPVIYRELIIPDNCFDKSLDECDMIEMSCREYRLTRAEGRNLRYEEVPKPHEKVRKLNKREAIAARIASLADSDLILVQGVVDMLSKKESCEKI